MDVIIRGKRGEGKTSLALLLAGFVEDVGHVVTLVEADGSRRTDDTFHHSGIDHDELEQGWCRNVDITVEQKTEQPWDGTLILDRISLKAAERLKEIHPELFEDEA